MTNQSATSALRAYGREVAQARASGLATEHTYRPALKTLIETLGGGGVNALNEPTHVDCGAPDFIIERGGVPIGHVECKDVGVDLDDVEESEQLKRYREGLPNLILTDYLVFHWYADGTRRESARLGILDGQGKIRFDSGGAHQVADLISAFFTANMPSIGNPRELARRMASKTRLLREGVSRILKSEGESGHLRDLLSAYREVLITDLSPTDFADMQAQTAAYGLFAARCRHEPGSGPFTRQSAVFAETTPFLRDVFGRIAGPGIDQRIAWIVDDLARLLDRADMEAILADFGSRTVQEDPVVHFYEDFLAAYDPKLRKTRGVYYTPEPVVSYIVRSVDGLLRDRFGLADGLADTEKITVEIPDGAKEESPRVLILDPAAGTGSFLREVVMAIRTTIESKGLAGAWPDYVRDHLLPRLFGFELEMAPYAICHLKLALEIGGREAGFTMPDGERLNVFLTNTLEMPDDSSASQIVLMAHEIAREAASADAVKRVEPVMVVLGNPPYFGHSANKGQWIRDLLRGKDGVEDTGSYFEVDAAPLDERNPKWLNDDYVKFIRFAQRRIERTGEGVLGFVTNHSYLDNPTFRGMRQSLMETFDEIYLLDLHGNSRRKERAPNGGKDENVFDIRPGVAIGLFVKRSDAASSPAKVFHADLWGTRSAKYTTLAVSDRETTDWKCIGPTSPDYMFKPRESLLDREYEQWQRITEIAPVNSVGVVTGQDKVAIRWSANEVVQVAHEFTSSLDEELITPILYRPFDTRYTYYNDKVITRPRNLVMRHVLSGPNVGLIVSRQASVDGEYSHVLASRSIIDNRCIYSSRGISQFFPLYTYPTEEQRRLGMERQPTSIESLLRQRAPPSVSSSFHTARVSSGNRSDQRMCSTTSMRCSIAQSTAGGMPTF